MGSKQLEPTTLGALHPFISKKKELYTLDYDLKPYRLLLGPFGCASLRTILPVKKK